MKTQLEKEILYSMSNYPGNWKGTFYVNKKDPRILVPKANPATGWTLNFGKPISYVVVAVFVMIVIASVFLLK
jgi:uncharacterized membrane protein